MQSIVFTAADLIRTRLQSTLGPVAEGVFALGPLTRSRNPDLARWRGQVLGRLREELSPGTAVLPLLQTLKAPEDLHFLLGSAASADSAASTGSLPSRADLIRLAGDVWRFGVAPIWDRILERLDSECDARSRIAMTGGVELLLATLHPRIVWNPPVLEIHDRLNGELRLNGCGLLLSPSVFLPDAVGRVIETERNSGQPALVFGLPPDTISLFTQIPDEDGVNGQEALSALVGQTRASALRSLTHSCTTTQLAARLGISAGSASQHASILRESGLITTLRVRNWALHTVTPLGRALLGGRFREQPGTPRSEAALDN